MLFNRTDAKLSLTSWVEDVLPKDPVLFVLIGCPSVDSLPPLGSYFDFMDRFWGGSKECPFFSSPKREEWKETEEGIGG